MNEMPQLFTPVMVIGSILSLIFAAGALWNSISRKRHLAMLEQAENKEEKIVFKPMPANAPPRETASGTGTGSGAARRTASQQLFRQIRPTGAVESEVVRRDEDPFVWE